MFYYSINGQQTGPVSEEELRRLVGSGALGAETLVWREGMAEWQAFSKAVGGVATVAMVPCSVCKQTFPVDQTIQYGGANVCAGCKPRFVQGLKEGAAEPGQNAQLYAIALNQRRALGCVAGLLICNISQVVFARMSAVAALVFLLGTLISMVLGVVYIYRLAKSLGKTAIVYAIAMFLPCVGLLVLLVVISSATKVLKSAGVRVGLLGVGKDDLERLRRG